MISYGFLITSLVVILIPGTGVIYTVSAGIAGSKRDSLAAAIGCTAGIIPHIIAGAMGLSIVLYSSSIIFRIMQIAGAVYLVYLGIGMIRDHGIIEIRGEISETGFIRIIVKAVLINLLNPKLTLFFLSFLPQFITSDTYFSYQLIILGGIFMALTFLIFILYGLLANYFKLIILNSPVIMKRIERFFGLIFIGFAAKLVLSDK